MAIIHLVPGSLQGSSSLPKSVGRAALLSHSGMLFYLTLLRVGFTLPSLLPATRCALTAPFHPYLAMRGGVFSVALSVGSPLPRVTRHTALWSSDFPRPQTRPRLPVRLRHRDCRPFHARRKQQDSARTRKAAHSTEAEAQRAARKAPGSASVPPGRLMPHIFVTGRIEWKPRGPKDRQRRTTVSSYEFLRRI